MAPIIIYGLEMSGPVRAVLVTAHCLQLKYEIKEVNLIRKDQLKEEFIKINPQHTVPTLDDNGFILWDSAAICAYLVGKYGKDDSLYPKDLQKRAIVDQRLHFNSGILFPRLHDVLHPIFHSISKVISKEHHERIIEAYHFLEKFLANSKWLAGEQMTVADLCCITSISCIYTVIPIDAKKFPKLTRWIENCKKLPCYQINCAGEEQLKTRILNNLK